MNARPTALSRLPGLWREFRPRRGSFSGEVAESLATNVGIAGLTVLSGVMLARLLGPEKRGELAAIQALPMIVTALGQLGLNEAVIYFGGKDRERAGRMAVSAVALIFTAGVPIVLAAAALTSWYLHGRSPDVVLASQLYLCLLFVNALDGIAVNTARALHRISAWNALRSAPRVLWTVVAAGFYALGLADPGTLALVFLVAYVPVALGMVLSVRRHLRGAWRPDPKLWPGLLRYGLPVATGSAPRLLNERLDQLFIIGLLSMHDVGLYSVAISWSNLATMPGMALSSVAFSKIAGMQDSGEQWRFIRKALWAVTLATGGTVLALGLVTPVVIRVFFGEEFAGAIPVCWVLLLVAFVRNVAWMQQTAMQGVGRPVGVLVSQWIGLAALLPAALLLIPPFGVNGAAWALTVAALSTWAAVTWLLRRARLGSGPIEPESRTKIGEGPA